MQKFHKNTLGNQTPSSYTAWPIQGSHIVRAHTCLILLSQTNPSAALTNLLRAPWRGFRDPRLVLLALAALGLAAVTAASAEARAQFTYIIHL